MLVDEDAWSVVGRDDRPQVTPTLATVERPETRYAQTEDGVNIAYQVWGEGPVDLVMVNGFFSHAELVWDHPPARRFLERLGSFARVVSFDRRGSGLSDPVTVAPTLDVRMEDLRAVMDEAEIETASLLGWSEGASMAALFAATYPERTHSLVLYGAVARATAADDFHLAPPRDALVESTRELIAPHWGEGATVEVAAPNQADDDEARAFYARMERHTASPGMIDALFQMFLDVDIRAVLPVIRVPALVLHKRGDRLVNIQQGRWVAERIPGARLVELPGIDHNVWYEDPERFVGEVEEFVTGVRTGPPSQRVLLTCVFTDIVGSTSHASRIGDQRWSETLDRLDALVDRLVTAQEGAVVKQTGDGHLVTFTSPGRAIEFAPALRDGAADLGISLRIGIHTGEVERRGDDIGGIAVHLGARVMSEAAADEILVSASVPPLMAGSGLGFVDRGVRELAGVPDAWRLYSVDPASSEALTATDHR